MRNADSRTWIMARKLNNVENEPQTLYDLEYGENTEKREKRFIHIAGPGLWRENGKTWKMRQKQYMTCKMSRNTEKHEKWKCTLQDLEYNKKTEKYRK